MKAFDQSWDEETKGYFATLPPVIQESIMQSGVSIEDCSALRQMATHMLAWHPDHHDPETGHPIPGDEERYL